MSRVEVWQHAQRLAGLAYTVLGGILLIVMGLICLSFGKRLPPELVLLAAKCLIWEVVFTVAVTLAVDIIIVVLYDFKGEPRKNVKNLIKSKVKRPARTSRSSAQRRRKPAGPHGK